MRIQDLYDVSWRRIKLLGFSLIHFFGQMHDKNQADNRHLVQGVGVLLLLLCRHYKLDPRSVLTVSDRVLRRAESVEPEYPRAILTYLKEELGDE